MSLSEEPLQGRYTKVPELWKRALKQCFISTCLN